jgi:hypothetical protein
MIVIASAFCEAISCLAQGIASSQNPLLAMTLVQNQGAFSVSF